MSLYNELSPADIRACTEGNNNNRGFGFGGDGAWWIIILFLFALVSGGFGSGGLFGGGGRSGGVTDGYVLTSDFANIERKLDGVNNGLCSGFYQDAQLISGVNMNMANGFANAELSRANAQFALMQQLNNMAMQYAQCCCETKAAIADVKYAMSENANGISREVERGFCDTQYRDAANTNALMQSGHADTDRIIAKLDAMENARKDETIARQNQEIFQWQLRSSQSDQTAQLLRELGYQCPKPAYVVQPPQQVTFPTNCCGGVNYAYSNGNCGGNCM